MPPAIDFPGLIDQVRSGDEGASAELVRLFAPFIQRMVRIRMRRRGDFDRLRREIGASDVCQSVFRSLFHGLRKNRYRLDQPGDLEKLLQVMIRFNVATKARLASVKLREFIDDFEQAGWMDSGPRPDRKIAEQDWIEAIQEQFTEAELELLTLWLDDTPWSKIGQKLGCSGDAARVRLSRAVARVRERMSDQDHPGA
jgi:DNA-directed RNA polymerase specialized sigma24 family protein